MVTLWGRQWTRDELLARVGRLEQVAGIRLVEGGDGAERGVRLLRCHTGAGFDFEILVDRGFDVGGAWLGGRPLAWASPAGLVGPWYCEPAGIGWFRGFPGGLVSTCGLDHTLLGGPDDATVFNYPHGSPRPTGCTAGTPACRPGWPGTASAGTATTACCRPRARSCRPRCSASSCCCGGGSRPTSAGYRCASPTP